MLHDRTTGLWIGRANNVTHKAGDTLSTSLAAHLTLVTILSCTLFVAVVGSAINNCKVDIEGWKHNAVSQDCIDLSWYPCLRTNDGLQQAISVQID